MVGVSLARNRRSPKCPSEPRPSGAHPEEDAVEQRCVATLVCLSSLVVIDIYRGSGTLRNTHMPQTKTNKLLTLARKRQVIRSKDLNGLGIPRNYLPRLARRGLLQRVGWGLYSSASSRVTEHLSLLEATHKVPKGIICLLSALSFHGFTTQSPSEVWMAIDVKAWAPTIGSAPIRIVRFSGEALHFGRREHAVKGGKLNVYTPAKTVADCFKFRHKIGTDVAIEALKECYRLKKASMDDLWAAATVCRVANIMRPYMESL